MTFWTVTPMFSGDQKRSQLEIAPSQFPSRVSLKISAIAWKSPDPQVFSIIHRRKRFKRISRIALVTGDSSQPYRW